MPATLRSHASTRHLQKKMKVRAPFRIIASIVTVLAIYSFFLALISIKEGYYFNGFITLLLSIWFFFEFGSIAVRQKGILFDRKPSKSTNTNEN